MRADSGDSLGTRIVSFAGVVAAALTWYLVDRFFGPTEGVRAWGMGLLAVSVFFTFRKEIPVTIGRTEVTSLVGFRKALVLVPTYAIGLLISFKPHEVACAVHLKRYICE